MSTPRLLPIEILSPEAIRPYGWMLGKPLPAGADAIAYTNPATDFWQEHVFDPGPDGEPEFLWVNYRDNDPDIRQMERHHLTQQAVVPLVGEVTQILALPAADGAPDPATLRAFRLFPGIGICMRKGVWHTSRSRAAQCLMLTRRSTSADLVRHFAGAAPALESTVQDIAPVRLLADA